MTFDFATAGRIVFGPGRIQELASLTGELGVHPALLTGRSGGRMVAVRRRLEASGLRVVGFETNGAEPDLAGVQALAERVRESGADCVIGVGGGAVLDTAKAVAALVTNPGDPLRFLEVVGQGLPLEKSPLPVIAVPTTAGTGSEVTRNAVLGVPSHRAKVSLRHPLMLPRVALVDPELTYSVPPALTATTGLDALTQCLEPLVSVRANPLADAFAWAGLTRATRALAGAYRQGDDPVAREDMAFASLCGGLALANSGLGAVHGLAGALGGLYPQLPHGALCAALLAPVMAANIQALRERAPASPVLQRFAQIARVMTNRSAASAEDGVRWVAHLVQFLGVSDLATLGVPIADFGQIAERALATSSMKGNPIALTQAELVTVLGVGGAGAG